MAGKTWKMFSHVGGLRGCFAVRFASADEKNKIPQCHRLWCWVLHITNRLSTPHISTPSKFPVFFASFAVKLKNISQNSHSTFHCFTLWFFSDPSIFLPRFNWVVNGDMWSTKPALEEIFQKITIHISIRQHTNNILWIDMDFMLISL